MNILIYSFVIVMFGLFFGDIKTYYGDGEHKDFKSTIVSFGVLGTFVGIFIGLLGFDTANISHSVPQLLEGLKFAFLTSIVGMAFAVGLSILQGTTSNSGSNATDEITILNQIKTNIVTT